MCDLPVNLLNFANAPNSYNFKFRVHFLLTSPIRCYCLCLIWLSDLNTISLQIISTYFPMLFIILISFSKSYWSQISLYTWSGIPDFKMSLISFWCSSSLIFILSQLHGILYKLFLIIFSSNFFIVCLLWRGIYLVWGGLNTVLML